MAKPIDAMKIKHLDSKIRILWAFNAIVFAAFIWLIATVISQLAFPDGLFGASSAIYPFMFFMVIGIFLVPYLVWVELRFRNYTYYISETEMIIRRGVLRIERTTIPFEKVQNVNVSRSVLERLMGLATLKIETAGTNPGEAEGLIPGVGSYRDVVDEILERVEHSRAMASRGNSPEQPQQAQAPHEHDSAIMKEISALRDEIKLLRREKEDLEHTNGELKEEVEKRPEGAPPEQEKPEAREEPAAPEVEPEKPQTEAPPAQEKQGQTREPLHEEKPLEAPEPEKTRVPLLEFEGDRYKKSAAKKVIPKNSKKPRKKK